jgi:hypothetical protein
MRLAREFTRLPAKLVHGAASGSGGHPREGGTEAPSAAKAGPGSHMEWSAMRLPSVSSNIALNP